MAKRKSSSSKSTGRPKPISGTRSITTTRRTSANRYSCGGKISTKK